MIKRPFSIGLWALLAALALTGCQTPAPVEEPAPPTMPATLTEAVKSNPYRKAENAARDQWRHPEEVLEFCGIQPDKTVAEIYPSGGWWTEILAPYLRDDGRYIAVTQGELYEGRAQDRVRAAIKAFKERLAAAPEPYGAVEYGQLNPPRLVQLAPDGEADVVVTFRNLHNFMRAETTDAVVEGVNRALKPGGIFCVVDHRARPETPWDPLAESGYVHEQQAISLIEPHGFRLVERSEVNANPRDTRDYPQGVWTLPPRLRLGDQDREKYLSIGESDRFTLKFRKTSDG